MALIVDYTFNGFSSGATEASRDGWQVRLIGETYSSTSTTLGAITIQGTAITRFEFDQAIYGSPGINFSPGSNVVYKDASESYINYRTSGDTSVHPSTGFSFDTWFAVGAQNPNNDIFNGIWNWGTVDTNTYSLNTNNYSLFYQYDDQIFGATTYNGPNAWGYQKGGTMTINCTLTP